MRLEIASSLIELSVGGGGQTKLSIISTFRLPTEIAGGSGKDMKKSRYFLVHVSLKRDKLLDGLINSNEKCI